MCFLSIFPLAGLLIIALLIYMKVWVLKKKGVQVSVKGSKKNPVFLFLYPLFLVLLVIWMAGLATATFNLQLAFFPSFLIQEIIFSNMLRAAGVALILFSVVLMLITLVHFNSSLRFGLSQHNKGKLITTGIFSFTRNPFFLSIDLFFTGQAIVFPAPLFIAMAVFAIVSIHLFILKEEKFMQVHYPDDYPTYVRKVRRYL